MNDNQEYNQLMHMLNIIKGAEAYINQLKNRNDAMFEQFKELSVLITESGNPTLIMHMDRIGRKIAELHNDPLKTLETLLYEHPGYTLGNHD